jgi:hypothetical protein
MGSCPCCGKRRVHKRKDGRRKCPRCGFLPGIARLDRSGFNTNGEIIIGNGNVTPEMVADDIDRYLATVE